GPVGRAGNPSVLIRPISVISVPIHAYRTFPHHSKKRILSFIIPKKTISCLLIPPCNLNSQPPNTSL
ncbi:MAG: hypothetical protein ABL876_01430, partial [Chitinophagaceae bacterium]